MEVMLENVPVLVDDADYEWLKKFSWRLRVINGKPYVWVRGMGIHQLILAQEIPPDGKGEIDHINRNGLDNRRENLRWCNRQENVRNSSPRRDSSSKYKGVSWHVYLGKWGVTAYLDSYHQHIGYFKDEGQAALAYDKVVREHYGYGFLNQENFPELEGLELTEVPVRGSGKSHMQRGPRKGKYKGVVARDGKFLAVITVEGKQKSLGRYATAEEAALVYDKAAREAFGEQAYQNLSELQHVE